MYKIYTENKQPVARWNSLELAKKFAHLYATQHNIGVYIVETDHRGKETEIYRIDKQKQIG